jgi:GlpG protein
MRCIGSLANEQLVERFVAYLVTKNIPAYIEKEGAEPKIWIKNEDDVTQARELLARFAANPTDTEFSKAIERASEILREEARKRSESKKLVKTFSAPTRPGPTYRAPLTVGVTTLCIVLWFLQTFTASSGTSGDQDLAARMAQTPLFRALAFTSIPTASLPEVADREADDIRVRNFNVLRGEVWRLVTPIFIHFGVAHLIFNLLAFYQLGRVLEHRYGTLFLGLAIVAIAVISNFLQAATPESIGGSPLAVYMKGDFYRWQILHEIGSDDQLFIAAKPWGLSLFGGISGVVFGMLGIAWMKSRFDWSAGFYVPRAMVIWAIAWFALGLTPWDVTLLGANMANWAHGAGLVLGVLIGYFSSSPFRGRRKSS